MFDIPYGIDLLNSLKDNKSEVKNYEDVISLNETWHRHLFLGEIDDAVGEAIESLIRFWNQIDDENKVTADERKPIYIFINSPGGDLSATFTMIDAITMSKTPVYTVNIGCAYSGGFLIFLAGHKRIAYPNSTFLFHEGSVSEVGGDAGKFQNFSAFYKERLGAMKEFVLAKTNMIEDFYESIKRDDFWMTAAQAIEYGVADEITSSFIG